MILVVAAWSTLPIFGFGTYTSISDYFCTFDWSQVFLNSFFIHQIDYLGEIF